MTCLASEGDLPITIEWSLNGRKIQDFPEISTSKMGKRSSILAIEAVSYIHAGNYTCLAKNKAGNARFVTQLLVNGIFLFNFFFLPFLPVPPQITHFDFGSDPINSGDMVSVFCIVNKGDFPLGIQWTLNGRSVDEIDGITVLRTSKRITQLNIESVQAEHSGKFVCSAENPAGKIENSAYLRVNGTKKFHFVPSFAKTPPFYFW